MPSRGPLGLAVAVVLALGAAPHSLPASLVLPGAAEARADILAGPIPNPANGHLYYLLTTNTWTASEAEARSLGGHLVTINDAQEQEWVFTTFGTLGGRPNVLWIGLTDRGHEGTFTWVSGQVPSFTNWEVGQPDDSRAIEHYVGIWPPGPRHPGSWNDWPDDTWTGSGCECVPFIAEMHGVVEVERVPI